jgi:hypothetical protein
MQLQKPSKLLCYFKFDLSCVEQRKQIPRLMRETALATSGTNLI